MTDALQTKEKIISFIESNGPSLPIQVAKETGMSILFSSAFLSELYNEKRLSMSNLRVGSSPLYFIPGQEPQLERFATYLKNKEKEAFQILKEYKFLEDSKLHPAIRVALREIKDYAIPFKKDEEIFWKFFTISDDEIRSIIEKPAEVEIVEIIREEKIEEPEKEIIEEVPKKTEKVLNIFDEEKKVPKKKEPVKKIKKETKSKKPNKKKDENFFNKIKEFLAEQKIEIVDIINFKNDEAKIRVRKKDSEELLFAFNKKKITEKEILKANKEASEEKMKYGILSLGETTKKLNDFIDAIRNLSEIGKIE
jgi:5-formyltetrahydrofolate cyclo-ligase